MKFHPAFLWAGMAMACLLTSSGQAQNFSSCDQWATWQVNGYTIYNNIWGSGAGTQCIWAYSQSNWGVTADHPNTSGIKSYPNVDLDVNYTISSMPTITSAFNVTRPGSGSYNSAYDIWYNNYAYEVMLWVNWNGSMGPISYNYGCSGYPSTACPVATNISVGGHTWNLYAGTNGSATVYSFLRTSNTNSGTVNITQISQWLANNGYFSSSTNLHEIQFGFEISQSAGGLSFTVNSYSVSIGGSSSTTYYRLQNRGTGLYLDGMGRTTNGDACGQYANTTSTNAQWELIDMGSSYYQVRNRATGMYLDGMGRTTNGDDCGQWANTTHYNSHWLLQQYSGSYYRLQNRTTGLYLDGMGLTTNGANCGQYGNTTHVNAQWALVAVSSSSARAGYSESIAVTPEENNTLRYYPNPLSSDETFTIALSARREAVALEIVDLTGKALVNQQYKNVDEITLQPHLQSGMYLIRLREDGVTSGHRLVIR